MNNDNQPRFGFVNFAETGMAVWQWWEFWLVLVLN